MIADGIRGMEAKPFLPSLSFATSFRRMMINGQRRKTRLIIISFQTGTVSHMIFTRPIDRNWICGKDICLREERQVLMCNESQLTDFVLDIGDC